MKQLLVETIRIDGGTQSRAAIDEATVTEYVEAIQAGAKMPPILCYHDGTDMWLAEGFHRFLAYQRAEKRNSLAEVKNGTKEDAAWASAGARVRALVAPGPNQVVQNTLMMTTAPARTAYSSLPPFSRAISWITWQRTAAEASTPRVCRTWSARAAGSPGLPGNSGVHS